jgi:hypothetical protein
LAQSVIILKDVVFDQAEFATARGGTISPYPLKSESAAGYADSVPIALAAAAFDHFSARPSQTLRESVSH